LASAKQLAARKRFAAARKAAMKAGKKPFTKDFGKFMSNHMKKNKK